MTHAYGIVLQLFTEPSKLIEVGMLWWWPVDTVTGRMRKTRLCNIVKLTLRVCVQTSLDKRVVYDSNVFLLVRFTIIIYNIIIFIVYINIHYSVL